MLLVREGLGAQRAKASASGQTRTAGSPSDLAGCCRLGEGYEHQGRGERKKALTTGSFPSRRCSGGAPKSCK